MFLFGLFAMSGIFYNDVLALVSIVGSLILFLGSFPNSALKPLIGLAEWSSAPLVFGTPQGQCAVRLFPGPDGGPLVDEEKSGKACASAAKRSRRKIEIKDNVSSPFVGFKDVIARAA